VTSDFGFLLQGVSEGERVARCRELRALALVHVGASHPLTVALGEAVADPDANERALAELGRLPAPRRRKLLAAYMALLPRTPRTRHRRPLR
jgi:hypothetical protein